MKNYIKYIIGVGIVTAISIGVVFSANNGNLQLAGINIPNIPIKTFLGLQDTPDTYVGQNGKVVTVSTSTGELVFTATSSLGFLSSESDPIWTAASSSYLLASGSTTGATSQAQSFTNGVKTAKIIAPADSTTAVGIFKADGTTNVLNVDTTNGRVGIGTTAPATALHIEGVGPDITQKLVRATTAGLAFTMFDLIAERTVSTPTTANLAKIAVRGEMGTGAQAPYPMMVGFQVSNPTHATWYDRFNLAVGRYGAVGINPTEIDIRTDIGAEQTYGLKVYSRGAYIKGAGSTTGKTLSLVNSTPTEIFTVLDSGNVGIGTTTPGSKLTVSGHIGSLGTIPTLTSAGTGASIRAGSTDTAGEITQGTSATGAVITFATAYTNIPFAVVTSQAGLAFSYTVSTTAITITNIGALSETKLNYHVIARE
jgi:hypothetical protein